MRPIESYLVYLTLYAIWFESALPLTDTAVWALLFTFVAHLAIEKPRWQLSLLYAQITHLLYSTLLSSAEWPASWGFILGSSVLVMMSSALACLLPMARFPEFRGKFQAVGTVQRWIPTNFGLATKEAAAGAAAKSAAAAANGSAASAGPAAHGTAHHRHHHHGAKHTAQRYAHLGVTVFYPSSLDASPKAGAQFMTAAQLVPLAKQLGIPSWIMSHISLGRTKAVPELPLVSPGVASAAAAGVVGDGKKLPVVLFSHGLMGVANMYSMQACELASQGYVVFALTHNDGSAILADLPQGKSIKHVASVEDARGYMDESGDPQTASLMAVRSMQLQTRLAEMEFLVDSIVEAERNGEWPVPVPFAGRLDTERIAAVGHSFGGATAVAAAARDPRIKALVSHDVWCEPMSRDLLSTGLPSTPALHTISQKWEDWREARRDVVALTKASGSNARLIVFPGTLHSNYSDVPLFSQFLSRKLKSIGSVEMKEGMARINEAQVEFLKEAMPPSTQHAEGASNGKAASKRMFDALLKKQVIKIIDVTKEE